MTVYDQLIITLWLVLLAYWAIAAVNTKGTVGARGWWKESWSRLSVIALVLLALRVPVLRHALRGERAYVAGSNLIGMIGGLFCVLGIGLAILARVHLGRNWGMPASRKENPELVTTGPYARVRHPIYTGMLLAMLGSAIGESAIWVLPLIVFGVYLILSARREEKLMIEQFPRQYPAYMKRTKMLLPFVL